MHFDTLLWTRKLSKVCVPCRGVLKTHVDPYEIARGPGYIDPKVPVTKRPLSLYKCFYYSRVSLMLLLRADRSTSLHLVLPLHTDAIYDVDHGIAYDSKCTSPTFLVLIGIL